MVSCCRLLGGRSFVPEVRSWAGKDVPVNLHQTNVTLCPDKKGEGAKAHLSPSEVQAWLREGGPCRGASYPAPEHSSRTRFGACRQCPGLAEDDDLSWQLPQGQVPRPCPAVTAERARHPGPNWPSSSSGRPTARGQVLQTVAHADCRCH